MADSSDESEFEAPRPVIRIRRFNPSQIELNNNATTEYNNNNEPETSEPESAPETLSSTSHFEHFYKELPPVATTFVLLQLVIYFSAERCGIKTEEDISISWEKVVKERQFWRLLAAHFYHSNRCALFLNLITLLAMSRYLEKKIKPVPMLILVQIMGMVSNVFYMLTSTHICGNPAHVCTHGFSHVAFALKMTQIVSKDLSNNKGPTLIFGFYPCLLPPWLAPWEPFMEGVFCDIMFKDHCIARHVAGIAAGLTFPILDNWFHEHIVVTPRVSTNQSEAEAGTGNSNQEDETIGLLNQLSLASIDCEPASGSVSSIEITAHATSSELDFDNFQASADRYYADDLAAGSAINSFAAYYADDLAHHPHFE